ncbi:MAG: hypothetical protein QGG96_03250 [Candidatus Poseidoniaceae archaeon]|jgi:hypothetical protein|nr:hypothetical protein [Candidatus Poseidoniaceae archaeon]
MDRNFAHNRIMKNSTAMLISLLLLVPSIQGYSTGITGSTVDSGCICHGGGSPSTDSGISIEGVPVNWTADETYTIYVNLTGPESLGINQGGFNLRASVGTLSAIDNNVQVIDGQATHTTLGNDLRTWALEWTAPSFSGQELILGAHGNSVNGDGEANTLDHWNSVTTSVSGTEPPPNEEVKGLFSSTAIVAILIGIGFSCIFIFTTEALRIELEEE